MSSKNEPSAACCRTKPNTTSGTGYTPKGTYTEYAGLKTYVTGPLDAKSAIFLVYDIFGLYPQTIQGADILAYSNPAHPFRVYMPDFFGDGPADINMYPPDTAEKWEYIKNFFNGPANPGETIRKIHAVMAVLKDGDAKYVEAWGIMGHCWGGKVATLISTEGTVFKAAAQCHPSLIEPSEAKNVVVPMAVLASGDEDKEKTTAFAANLKHGHVFETFGDQVHGWMASKADFNDPRKTVEYYRGYSILSEFFGKHV